MRNILLSFFLTRPVLLKSGMAVMRKVTNSKTSFLNPDLNPLLRALIKPLIYDQFCAGTNKSEIRQTIKDAETLGFGGVILAYAKEIQFNPKEAALDAQGRSEVEIQKWLDGNLETLDLIQGGNWLGIKYV